MKKTIHPITHSAQVTCACGNNFTVGSTNESINVEICALCHPFFTGKQKFVDTAGRLDKFKERAEKTKKMQDLRNKGSKAKSAKNTEEKPKKTLKDLA